MFWDQAFWPPPLLKWEFRQSQLRWVIGEGGWEAFQKLPASERRILMTESLEEAWAKLMASPEGLQASVRGCGLDAGRSAKPDPASICTASHTEESVKGLLSFADRSGRLQEAAESWAGYHDQV